MPAKRAREPSASAVPPPAASSSKVVSALSQLLGDDAADTFFGTCWEKQPLHVSGAQQRLPLWRTLPTFETLLSVLGAAPTESVLCMKDQHPVTSYGSHALAYLDGCSLIVNHAETVSVGIGSLCAALRTDFPHAFGNLYATPPSSQAVDAHADDRDVIVVQLEGTKAWKVYGPPPVAFPTHDEQVGKGGRAVPPTAVGDDRVALRATLRAGDVLYIPRGFVHEATTAEDAASLHLTIALPTADWSWAAVAAAVQGQPDMARRLRERARRRAASGSAARDPTSSAARRPVRPARRRGGRPRCTSSSRPPSSRLDLARRSRGRWRSAAARAARRGAG